MKKKKKLWRQPQLAILVRGEHDERVLVNCKVDGISGDPSTGFSMCWDNSCARCFSTDAS